MDFKEFMLSEDVCMSDVNKTLKKVPKKHRNLVRGFKYCFQPGNTLKGDNKHIGFIDEKKKTITIASPWNYGRGYTLLHELGHAVWKHILDNKKKKEWKRIVKNTKKKQRQGAEELFCMAYANTYAERKIQIHSHDSWDKFIKSIAK
jgi:hypothetical protein